MQKKTYEQQKESYMPLSPHHPLNTYQIKNSAFVTAINACRPQVLPIWFMRQAGRSLPEYRTARTNIPMLDACKIPDLVATITLQPIKRYAVDAAIFYSDIVVPLSMCGIDVSIVENIGPVFADPITSPEDVKQFIEVIQKNLANPNIFNKIKEAVALIIKELPHTPSLVLQQRHLLFLHI